MLQTNTSLRCFLVADVKSIIHSRQLHAIGTKPLFANAFFTSQMH